MLASFHLLATSVPGGLRLLAGRWRRPPPGRRYAAHLWSMELGAPVVSPRRLRVDRVALFALWDDEEDLDRFLAEDAHGRRWATGWHVRLAFLRQWGSVAAIDAGLPPPAAHDPAEPVVAVTLARMRLLEVPRFISWGRPVEVQVRDHPSHTLAMAAASPPGTVATFTVWRSAAAMTDMVAGRYDAADAARHAAAMRERDRRDFHHEFTTLRFRCLAEHGTWQGRTAIVPTGPGAP